LKKLIVVLVLLLIAVFIGGPYYAGKIAETETRKLVDKMNQSSAGYGSTEILDYDRGVRSTSARYKYVPPAQFGEYYQQFGEIIAACESQHGITGIDYSCTLEGESAYSRFVAEKLDGKDPLSVYGSISTLGAISQTIALNEIKNLELDGATLSFPNAKMSIETDAEASAFKLNGNSDAFVMTGNGETLSVGGTVVNADFTRTSDLLFTGDMLMELDHFKSSGVNGETSWKNLSVTSNANEHGDTMSTDVKFAAASLITPGLPLESIKDLEFSFAFKGLDKQALVDYQQLIQQIQRDAVASQDGEIDPQFEAAQMAKLMPVVERMLKQGLEVNSNLSAQLDGQANEVVLNLALLESLSLAQMPLFLTNPDEALKKVDVSLTASLGKDLVDTQPLGAAFIAQNPLVVAGDSDYSLALKLGEEIRLNGKTMTFAELQGLILASMPR